MKKIYTLLFILSIASFNLFAQSLQLLTHSGAIIPNGGSVELQWSLYDTTVDVNIELKLKNISSSPVDIKALKVIKILPGAQRAYFCFAGNCFDTNVYVSPNQLTLAAGATDENFSAHINPTATTGNSVVYYKFYTVGNTNDTVSVYIQSKVWHLGIDNLTGGKAELGAAYPNPANEKFTVDYSLAANETARVVLLNMLGTTIREEIVSGANGKIQMNVAELPEGIYFYSLYAGNKNMITRKLLIRH